jgi:hypothetical protein
MASQTVLLKAMYSASVDDSETILCFRVVHDTVDPKTLKTYPVIDFRSSISFAQSASAYPMIFSERLCFLSTLLLTFHIPVYLSVYLFIYQFIYMFQIQVPSLLFQTFHITLKS